MLSTLPLIGWYTIGNFRVFYIDHGRPDLTTAIRQARLERILTSQNDDTVHTAGLRLSSVATESRPLLIHSLSSLRSWTRHLVFLLQVVSPTNTKATQRKLP